MHHLAGLVLVIAGLLIWTGHRLRGTLPGLADGLVQIGLATELLTFFALISNHLPATIAWVPLLSWAITLLAQLVWFQARVMHHPHHYIVEDNDLEFETPGQRMMNLHPNNQLNKTILGHVIAAIVVLVTLYNRSIPEPVILVLISTSVGFAAIWAGLQMIDILPNFASRVKQLGVAISLTIFFDLSSKHLPTAVAWAPWLCCALSLIAALHPQLLLQERAMHRRHCLVEENALGFERPETMNTDPNQELTKAMLGHVMAAVVVATFFGHASVLLPASAAWVPWLCWALSISAIALSSCWTG